MIYFRFLSLFIARPTWDKKNLVCLSFCVYIDNISISMSSTPYNNQIWSALLILHTHTHTHRVTEGIDRILQLVAQQEMTKSNCSQRTAWSWWKSVNVYRVYLCNAINSKLLKDMRLYKIHSCFIVVNDRVYYRKTPHIRWKSVNGQRI